MLLFPVRCNRRGDGYASFTWRGGCTRGAQDPGQYIQIVPNEVAADADCDGWCDPCSETRLRNSRCFQQWPRLSICSI